MFSFNPLARADVRVSAVEFLILMCRCLRRKVHHRKVNSQHSRCSSPRLIVVPYGHCIRLPPPLRAGRGEGGRRVPVPRDRQDRKDGQLDDEKPQGLRGERERYCCTHGTLGGVGAQCPDTLLYFLHGTCSPAASFLALCVSKIELKA